MSQRLQLSQQKWEGIYTADFTLDGIDQRCRQLGEALLERKWSCLIAHDTRFMAGQYALYVYNLLESYGVQVSFCPTPAPFPAVELALEQRRADTALIVSASNRPSWYCGLIVLAPATRQPLLESSAPSIDKPVPQLNFPPAMNDSAERPQIDLRAPYLEALRAAVDVELIRRASLTVFVDPMNGTTSGYIPAAIGEGGQTKAIEINREIDPLFGRQAPQPVEVGLQRLRKLVKESDSHLGVAISADGRALSVVDNLGEVVAPLDLALLLANYLSRQHRQRGMIIVPQPTGNTTPPYVRTWEEALGLKVELAADPAARIAELLVHDRGSVLVGVTTSGEVTIGRHSATPDATLAALVLIEIIARLGQKLRSLVDEAKGNA